MKVSFTPSARTQFLSALAYIRRDKPSAAIKFRKHSETVLRRLEDFPESGRIIPEFSELPFREVIISPYRFFYKIKGDIVWIIAVMVTAKPSEYFIGEDFGSRGLQLISISQERHAIILKQTATEHIG